VRPVTDPLQKILRAPRVLRHLEVSLVQFPLRLALSLTSLKSLDTQICSARGQSYVYLFTSHVIHNWNTFPLQSGKMSVVHVMRNRQRKIVELACRIAPRGCDYLVSWCCYFASCVLFSRSFSLLAMHQFASFQMCQVHFWRRRSWLGYSGPIHRR
jgi:hypothetical protein